MPLSSGSRLGSYEILSPLGAGGMGEVYRARDGKLNRDVQPVPPTGAVYSIRGQRADQPHETVWSLDGKELFYNPRAGGFEVVAVTTQPEFAFGNPTPLPRPFQLSRPQSRRAYDITPAGMFVGLVTAGAGDVSAQLEVVRQLE
jgi:serine/threonine protein kinase